MMMRLYGLMLFALVFTSCNKRRFDTLITNVAIYDGSENAAIMGDVGINADTIAAVGDLSNATAALKVDGTGLAIAPGFIDTHSHHDRGLNSAPDALAAVSQGITTIIVGQDGGSEVPINKYFQHLSDSPVAVNIGSFSGHNSIRSHVLGNDFKRKATQEEVARMVTMLKADMKEGALGLSSGLEYDPGIYSSKEEVLAMSKALKPFRGRYISHLRSEDRYFWDALNEIVTIGREAAIPVQISHFKLAMRNLWGKADSTLNILDRARKEGINITADLYPYTYWSSTIRVLFPDRNFKDAKEADFILREVTTPEGIVFSNYQPNPEYNGKTLAAVALDLKVTPSKMLIELIRRLDDCDKKYGECDGSIVATSMKEEDVIALMRWEFTNICSDGASAGRHPRGFGAFTRVLAHYVRDSEALTLQQAVHKMTALSAQNLGLTERGMIKPGYFADVVLFDPEQIADNATIQKPQTLSSGIVRVWVNGTEVYNASGTTKKYPGKVLRRVAM